MTKKHEELVEEIAREIEGYGDVEFDYITHTEAAVSSETLAQRIISLTLSAVRDGRLDEELGVVGRGIITCTTDGREIYQTDWKGRIPVDLPAIEQQHAWSTYDFIALRPLTGTGKEEEKNGDGSGRPD